MAKKKSAPASAVQITDKEAKFEALKMMQGNIEKDFGKGTLMRLGDEAIQDIEAISTGSIGLDFALGVGGLPRGRVTEIYGPESSGKTTLAIHVIAEAQKQGGICAIIDAEHAFDRFYAENLGVDVTNLWIAQPDNGEQALDIAEQLINSGAIDVLVIDSVAALTPRAEIEGEMGDKNVGLQARLMSQALRKLTGIISKTRTVCIFINQMREKIGVMFGNPETTPGGNALKFYASIRMDIRKTTVIKDPAGNIIGNRARVKVIKNKMAPPFRVAEFDIMYNEGISKAGSLLDVATDMGILEKRGSWFSLDGEQLGQGRDQTKALIAASPELQQKLMDRINAKIKGGEASAPMELPEESAEPAPAPEA